MSAATAPERLENYDYDLPAELVAQHPPPRRDDARLLILERTSGAVELGRIPDLVFLLRPGDLLVRNTTSVFPARLLGRRADTGGRVEALLVTELATGHWRALLRPARRLRPGVALVFDGDLRARIERDGEEGVGGEKVLIFERSGQELEAALERHGRIPLPPYIRRDPLPEDRTRYQTVFARTRGSVAAPTAGLHLTRELLAAIERRGVEVADVVLHVGPGTFRPVGEGGIGRHKMHAEPFDLAPETAAAVERCRRRGGRVVAIGTTVTRVLESRALPGGRVAAGAGTTDLFIHPPMKLAVVDALLTNFHLPRSTLLMLVSALAGRERILAAYRRAIDAGFRFYSYGDAMFIHTEAR